MSSASELDVAQLSKLFGTVAEPVIPYIIAGLVEMMLYGAHAVLIMSCTHIILGNKRRTRWLLLAPALAMFLISTTDIAITFQFFSQEVITYFRNPSPTWASKLLLYKHPLFVTNNFIAEFILLYRGYIVWNRSRYLLAVCSILVLADTIWGFIVLGNPKSESFIHVLSVYIWTVFGINVLLTGITAGRILWISKTSGRGITKTSKRSFQVMVAVIIESSALYSLCLIALMALPIRNKWRPLVISMLMRIVALTPTLLVVQIGLGRARATETCLSVMEHSGQEELSEVVLDTVLTSGVMASHCGVPSESKVSTT